MCVICQGNELCTGCSRFHHFSLLLNLIVFHPTFVLIQSLNRSGGGWRTAGRFLFVDVPISNLCLDNVLAFLMVLPQLSGIFRLLLLLGNDLIIPNSYQFIIHLPSTVWSRRYWQSRTINHKQVTHIMQCSNTGWRRTLNARCCHIPCSV